jgi:hypothetical protein
MTKEKLFELFITQDLSQRSVAKNLNCSQATVRYFLKKYNITKNKSYVDIKESNSLVRCSKCNEIKSLNDFYLRKTKKGELTTTSWCKKCNSKNVVSIQQKSKSILVELKGGACQSCGFKEYEGALEFHHIDPSTKDDKLSKFIRSKISKDIIDEINKCVLVCSNCHKMIHAELKDCPMPVHIQYDKIK